MWISCSSSKCYSLQGKLQPPEYLLQLLGQLLDVLGRQSSKAMLAVSEIGEQEQQQHVVVPAKQGQLQPLELFAAAVM